MARRYFAKRRAPITANVFGVGTPGMKMTARRGGDCTRNLSAHNLVFSAQSGVGNGNGREKGFGIWMMGPLELSRSALPIQISTKGNSMCPSLGECHGCHMPRYAI